MARQKKKVPYRRHVKVEVDGKEYTGTAHMEPGGIIVVESTNGEEATQLGGMPFEVLAKQLLRELVRKGLA